MSETVNQSKPLKEQVEDVLRTIYDPEIPLNIYELGLIYELDADESSGTVAVPDRKRNARQNCAAIASTSAL